MPSNDDGVSPSRHAVSPRACFGWLLTIVATKVVLGVWLYRHGFHAISDDDYARLVIAQQFAANPSWDPSGTSWLPLPFWLQGSAYLLVGIRAWLPLVVSLGLSALSVVLVYVSARLIGASRPAALAAAALTGLLPHALWLGTASVPSGYTASLMLLGMACVARAELTWRAVGSVALLLASLCRYEAWPVALLFSAFCTWDVVLGKFGRGRTAFGVACAALTPLFGAGLWLLHGFVNHGDALFFVKRVVAYREALGGNLRGLIDGIFHYPLILLRAEPELTVLGVAAFAVYWGTRHSRPHRAFRRPALIAGAVLVFLIVGDVRGGAATHHSERPLLALWLLAAVWVAWVFVDRPATNWMLAFGSREFKTSRNAVAVALLPALLASHLIRPWITRRDSFADRDAEFAMGQMAQRRLAAGTRLGIHTGDFGYFAVQAGFGRPDDSLALAPPDPRLRAQPSPFESQESLRRAVQAERLDWLVVGAEHHELAVKLGTSEVRLGKLSLIRLN